MSELSGLKLEERLRKDADDSTIVFANESGQELIIIVIILVIIKEEQSRYKICTKEIIIQIEMAQN